MVSSILRITFTAILALGGCAALADTITLNTSAPTVGYGRGAIGAGGPFFTYTAAASSPIALGSTPLILDTSTQNFGEYTYNSGPFSSNMLSVTLSVTPTVNGTTAATPLVFNGTLETGFHSITQPTPYLINSDPGLNPSAQLISYGAYNILALPFDGDLFGVEIYNYLDTPASTGSTVGPVLGFIAPQSSVPETASGFTTAAGLLLLFTYALFRIRKISDQPPSRQLPS